MNEAQIRDTLAELNAEFGAATVREVVELFLDESVTLLAALGEALDGDDLAATASRAHSIKSVAGNFGAADVVRLSAQMESAARGGEAPSKLRPLYRELYESTLEVRSLLERAVPA